EGTGIVTGTASSGSSPTISTKQHYGDLMLEFDVLVSHDAAATLWLQGRYGLKLADSWKAKRMAPASNGAILPPSTKGTTRMGYLPAINVARAPGIWQQVKVVFNAPKFNSKGVKMKNARLMSLEQNGITIQ